MSPITPERVSPFSSAMNLNSLSLTIKALTASLIPIVHLVTGYEIVNEQADKIIDAIFVLISFGLGIYGYIRSKSALQNQVIALGGSLGSTKAYSRKK